MNVLLSAFALLAASLVLVKAAPLPACPDAANADFDFVVVGAGAGGGPLAARLAEAGFSGEQWTYSSIDSCLKALSITRGCGRGRS